MSQKTKTSLNTFELPGRFDLPSKVSWQFWNPCKSLSSFQSEHIQSKASMFLAPWQSLCPSCQTIFVRDRISCGPAWPWTSDLISTFQVLGLHPWHLTELSFVICTNKTPPNLVLTPGGLAHLWDVWSILHKAPFLRPCFLTKDQVSQPCYLRHKLNALMAN